MAIFTLTAEDTLVLYDRVLNDLADGDAVTITFPNESVAIRTGKNRNTIFAKSEQGQNANVVIRVMRGSSDDQFLAGKLAEARRDFVGSVLANGSFVKRLGDGQGGIVNDTYTMQGGRFTRNIDSKENVSGDTEQGVAVYNMVFADVTKDIQ